MQPTMNGRRAKRATARWIAAAGAVVALALAGCGGGESGDDEPEVVTADTVTQCLEGIDQKVRKVDVSFAKLPPDLGVSSTAGSANVWITDGADGVQDVIAQEEELSKLGPADSLIPVSDRVLTRGNAIAVVSTDSSPDYRSTLEECFPAA